MPVCLTKTSAKEGSGFRLLLGYDGETHLRLLVHVCMCVHVSEFLYARRTINNWQGSLERHLEATLCMPVCVCVRLCVYLCVRLRASEIKP